MKVAFRTMASPHLTPTSEPAFDGHHKIVDLGEGGRRNPATTRLQGSNLYEHLAGVNDPAAGPGDLRGHRQALAGRQDYPAQRRAHHRERRLSVRVVTMRTSGARQPMMRAPLRRVILAPGQRLDRKSTRPHSSHLA